MKKNDYLTLNIESVLKFYDERINDKENDHGSSVSAITGLIGEDLVLGALEHYFKTKGEKEIKLDYRCRGTPQNFTKKGEKNRRTNSWLDAWIVLSNKCYQVEVKNWSASAFGGRSVVNEKEELIETAHHNMSGYLDNPRSAKTVWKVLKEMQNPPEKCEHPIPLLAFWSPIASEKKTQLKQIKPMFSESLEEHKKTIRLTGIQPNYYKKVTIFSASLYLRQLKREGKKTVRLHMPRAAERLRHLRKFGLKLN